MTPKYYTARILQYRKKYIIIYTMVLILEWGTQAGEDKSHGTQTPALCNFVYRMQRSPEKNVREYGIGRGAYRIFFLWRGDTEFLLLPKNYCALFVAFPAHSALLDIFI